MVKFTLKMEPAKPNGARGRSSRKMHVPMMPAASSASSIRFTTLTPNRTRKGTTA